MKRYLAFYIPYLVFIVALAALIICNEKADLHLWLSSFHNEWRDTFFKYYTEFGCSVPFIIVILLLFYKYRISLLILAAECASGMITHVIKPIFHAPRPTIFFQENFPDVILHKVEDTGTGLWYSFPSGHTTAAFAFFLSLTFVTKNKILQFLYFVMAVLVGYSRIYLSRHFAIDVLWGSIIGVTMTSLCYFYIFEKYPMKWANGSLIKTIRENRKNK